MKALFLSIAVLTLAIPASADANGCRLRVSEIVRIAHRNQAARCKIVGGCEVAILADAHVDGCLVTVSSGLDRKKRRVPSSFQTQEQ
jgi:hypothetical protein